MAGARLTPTQRAHRVAELKRREFLLPAEAAFIVNRDKSTLTRWIQKGLPTYPGITEERYVRLSDVVAWISDSENSTRRRRRA